MSEQLHAPRAIDIVVLEGENGTVHVSTPDRMDDAEVANKFESITSRLGDVASSAFEADEPAERQNKTDAEAQELGKMSRRYKGRPEHPAKAHK